MSLRLYANGWFPSGIQWADYNSNHSPMPDDAALSYEGGNQAVKHILIYAENLYDAVFDLVGSNIFNPTTGNLDRTLPMQHPIFNWLYVSRISSIKGFIPSAKSAFPGAAPPSPGQMVPVTTVPDYYLLTVLFQQPKYRMLPDDRLDALFGSSPRYEWERFIEGWPQPGVEFVNVESQSLSFLETSYPSHAIDGRSGKDLGASTLQLPEAFPSVWPQPLPKADIVLVWKKVPRVGLYNNGGTGRAVNLEAALQTTNQDWFFPFATADGNTHPGYAPGTLKLEFYKPMPVESPLPPEIQAGLQEGDPNLLADVQLGFKYWDPPWDANANNGSPTRGHNLGPWRGTPTGNPANQPQFSPLGNSLWYKIGAAGGDPLLFPTSDFRNMFLMSL